MATGQNIINAALNRVLPGSDSFDEPTLVSLFNQGIQRVARHRGVYLPALETSSTVVTIVDDSEVSLPVNYMKGLYKCQGEADAHPSVLSSRVAVMNKFRGKIHDDMSANNVKYVAAAYPHLVYGPIPAEQETLTLFYYRKPDMVIERGVAAGQGEIGLDDEINLVPTGFDNIFEYYLCWQMHSMLEMGVEGQKIDTRYYFDLFTSMLQDLASETSVTASRPDVPFNKLW